MFDRYYVFYFIWAFVSGYFQYIIAYSTLSHIVDSDGLSNDYWNTGLSIIAANVMSHHVLFCVDMRHFTKFMIFSVFLSLSMWYPVVSLLNDNLFIAPYY